MTDIHLNIDPQKWQKPEFADKPIWAKALHDYLWCTCDYAGFVDINFRVAKGYCNWTENLTDQEIWKGLEGLVVQIPNTSLGYVVNFIHTARAQGGKLSSVAGVHLKVYKDMIVRKQRFGVDDPVSIVREHNPFLTLCPLRDEETDKTNNKKEGNKDVAKDSPALLFEHLGIPNQGYICYYDEQQGLTQSVSVNDDNKSSSYTEQDDGVEDMFEAQPKEEDNKPLDREELDPLGLAAPDQSKPINPSVEQYLHDCYISEGQVMLKDGGYAANGWESLRRRAEEGVNETDENSANF